MLVKKVPRSHDRARFVGSFARKRKLVYTVLLSRRRNFREYRGKIHWKRKWLPRSLGGTGSKYNSKWNAKAWLLPLGWRRTPPFTPSAWISLLFGGILSFACSFHPSPSSVLLLFKWNSSSRIVPEYLRMFLRAFIHCCWSGQNLFDTQCVRCITSCRAYLCVYLFDVYAVRYSFAVSKTQDHGTITRSSVSSWKIL